VEACFKFGMASDEPALHPDDWMRAAPPWRVPRPRLDGDRVGTDVLARPVGPRTQLTADLGRRGCCREDSSRRAIARMTSLAAFGPERAMAGAQPTYPGAADFLILMSPRSLFFGLVSENVRPFTFSLS